MIYQKIKEYFNLQGHYLRLYLTNNQLSLISYNSNLLNGIKYESKINSEDIKANDKIKNLTFIELYDLISKKIREKKIMIQANIDSITLSLLENENINNDKDIQLILLKNNREFISEYENVLSNTIRNLKEENKIIKNEINEIKNMISRMNFGANTYQPNRQKSKFQSYNINQDINLMNPQEDISFKKKALSKPIIVFNNPLNSTEHKYSESSKQIRSPLSGKISNQLKNPISDTPSDKLQNMAPPSNQINNNNLSKEKDLTISKLANLEYGLYPPVELGSNSSNKISGYGANSYNGIKKNYNEDKIKIILDYHLEKTVYDNKGNIMHPHISYFGIYDGHGGNKCSNFLQEKLHTFLFNSQYFPTYTLQAIYESYSKAEEEFKAMAFDTFNNKLLDKSGSCSISILLIDEWCFVTYLGDSRALYSYDSGKQFLQISRDHKPNDHAERTRIEKAGGKVYKDTRLKVNGQIVQANEESMPGVKFPYRLSPGNIAVSY